MRYLSLAIILMLALPAARPLAQGATGASFLNLESDAGTAAVGGASATLFASPFASFHNPAGLAFLSGSEFSVSHSEHVQSVRYQNLAAAYGGRRLAVALSVRHLSLGEMEERVLPSAEPLSSFGLNAMSPSLSLARRINHYLSAGASLKLVYQKIGSDRASSFAGDAGLGWYDRIPGLRAGVFLSDWGGGVKFDRISYPLPSRFGLGVSYSLLGRALTFSGDLEKTRSSSMFVRFGSEFAYRDLLFLRAGYRGGRRQASGAAGLAAGVGLRVRDYEFGYSLSFLGDIGQSHLFSLSFHPGLAQRTRNESAVAAELQRRARITAETFFRQGQGHLLAGSPEEAAQSFDLALVWDPDYTEASRALAEARAAASEGEAARLLASGLSNLQAGKTIDAIYDLGRVLEIKPDHPAAREMLQKASDALLAPRPSLPSDTAAASMIRRHLGDGARALASGDYRRAIVEWEAALALDPGQSSAKASIERARILQRQAVDAALQKAEASARQERWPTALAYINRALDLDPDSEPALARKKEVIETLKRMAESHARKGAELLAKGDYEQAEAELRLALSLDRDNRTAAEQLSRLGPQRVKANARLIGDLYLKGIAAYTQEDYAQAAALWQRVLELDPGHANARRNLERAREKLRILGQ